MVAKKIFFPFLLLFFSYSFGQDLQFPKNIQSPNAASLGKYGDVPVSYYTGSPNVSIPLYSLNDYGMPLDIILNYDASGVRVNSMPGWVGQNWSLQAGGMVTRTVKGKFPDEFHLPNVTTNEFFGIYYGYFYPISHNLLNVNNWDAESYLSTLYNNTLPTNDFTGKEFAPDIFTFNFMGHTGKFFMGADGQWKVSSTSNLKITIEQDDFEYPFGREIVPFNDNVPDAAADRIASKMIYKITITDGSGNIYVFGNNDNNIEYSVPFFGQFPGRWTADTWYLAEVKNRFGKVIYSFEYERDSYITSFYKYNRRFTFSADINGGSAFLSLGSSCYYSGGVSNKYNGMLISPVYLSKINTNDGAITLQRSNSYGESYMDDTNLLFFLGGSDFMSFNNRYFYYYLLPYTTSNDFKSKLKWKKLYKIVGLSKTINLKYNETQPYTGGVNDRLNLLEVKVDDKTFNFEYNEINQLPKYLSTKLDHWGYFDGSDWSKTPTAHYNSRTPHTENVKKGSLTKIIYPTKGWTEFIWEANQYSAYLSDDKSQIVNTSNNQAGGLRVKKIIDNNNMGNQIIREFKYVKNYSTNNNSTNSSGIIENKPRYIWDNFRLVSDQTSSSILYEDLFSSNPIIPLSNYSGTSIGYSEVIEKRNDGSYKLYKYTSNNESIYRDEYNFLPLNPDPTPYSNFNDKSLLRGYLKGIYIYDSSNNLIQKTINTYNSNSTKYARSVDVSGVSCSGSPGNGFLKGSASKIYYFDNNLITQEVTQYLNPYPIIKKTNYDWNYYPNTNASIGDQFLQSKQSQTYLNSGNYKEEVHKEDYTYSFEINTTENNTLTGERYFTLLRTDVFKNNKKLSIKKIDYSNFNNKILPFKYSESKGNEIFEESSIVDSYDNNQQITQYHTKDGLYTTISYYNEYPLIKLEGEYTPPTAYLGMITSQIKSIINTQGWVAGKNQIIAKQQQARNYYNNHQVTSYTFKPNVGATSITDSRGKTEFYNYDSNERLSTVKDNDNKIIKQFRYNLK
ncbi:MAG: hypothetical protein L3J20_01840 [Flavobacteriaceae bacterium]|nr:hypothetical protein [Flavobacteriaceae bacterium]